MKNVNEESFEREVLASELPVLVDFSAVWCGPCKHLAVIVERIAEERRGALKVVTVDIDDAPRIAAKYGVRAAPTLIYFSSGEVRGKRVGMTTREKLLAFIDDAAASGRAQMSARA